MSRRSGHGDGRGLPRDETKPWDEQRHPLPGRTDPLEAGRDRLKRVRTTEAARALAMLPRRAKFLPRKVACDPRFEPHNKGRLEYLKGRRAEIFNAWGHVSRGASAMLNAAAWLWAGGQLAAELGAETGDAKHFATAANLYSQAKGLEAAAWELAERETKCPGAERQDAAPWLVPEDNK